MMLHKFNCPFFRGYLNVSFMVAELHKSENDPVKIKAFEMMTRNSQRLLRLVNQMLKLSHITEKTPQKKEWVNIAHKINMLSELYAHQASKNKIVFTVENMPDINILITEDALESTIGNFLSNAMKYTPKKGQIIVGSQVNDGSITIYVRDTGCGISDGDKDSIFQRFNRMTRHQNHQGLGIGLALAKEVADLNEAQINLESSEGHGSTFSITFACDLEKSVESKEPYLLVDDQATVIDQKNKPTVLIIEDNQDMLAYINTVLIKNYHCLLAENGKQGIALALKEVPDIVICDVMMPSIDGFQVCRRLRSEMITSHIPLVLLTAIDEKASRIKGWKENIDMYLNKPFDAQELNLQLRNILNIRSILQNSLKEDLHQFINHKHLTEVDLHFIEKLNDITENQFTDPYFGIDQMADSLIITTRQLQRKTKALLNLSPIVFLREFRLKKAADLLANGYQVSLIADNCGFSSISYFSQSFKNYYGLTPKAYQMLKNKDR